MATTTSPPPRISFSTARFRAIAGFVPSQWPSCVSVSRSGRFVYTERKAKRVVVNLTLNRCGENRALQIPCGSHPSWKPDPKDCGCSPEFAESVVYGGLRCIIMSLVGLMGGLGMVLSSPVVAHEFVETVEMASDVHARVCPVRGPGAPLSLLLRYPRSFRDCFHLVKLDVVRKGPGESMGVNYGQIVADRDDIALKKEMYTRDAWMGMRRLEKYGQLVDSVASREKMCVECTWNRRLLEQVWQTVANDYFDQFGSFSQSQWAGELHRTLSKAGGLLQTRSETYAAVKEMVSHLGDKYSSFLAPNEYRLAIHHPLPSEIKYLAYQYTGVGMELGGRSSDGSFVIVAPFAGSPAEEAGILGAEKLVAVDEMAMIDVSRDEAVALLRGPSGSTVELSISEDNANVPPRTVLVERRSLPLPPLHMRMLDAGDGRMVAYLRLLYFTHEGTKEMASAIREGEALGVDGYVLDLRNNPGGVFEEAVAMASPSISILTLNFKAENLCESEVSNCCYSLKSPSNLKPALWLDCEGCNVTETVRSNVADIEDLVYTVGKLPKEVFLKHPGALTHAPLTIITNRDSASASEVLTGALHDNHRVMIVGERTFGKGVVQYYFPMDDGSGLKLTVAKYLTPAHYDISRRGGLEPDRACHDYPHGPASLDECIKAALQMLAEKERPDRAPSPDPMPYRWLPLTQRRFWATGSY